MSTDYAYLAQSLSSLAGLPVRLYRQGVFQHLYHHTKFKPDPALQEEANIFQNRESVSYYMDENFLYYGLFRVKADDVALVIGPVAQMPVDTAVAIRILRTMGEPASRARELTGYFSAIPGYPLRSFLQILCTVNYFINGEKTDITELLLGEDLPPEPQPQPQMEPDITVHNTMELENRMLALVEHGRVGELEAFFRSPVAGRAGIMAADTLRQQKNLLICTATLVSRAAIRGGLGTETALALSDVYIKKAEMMTSPLDIARLNTQMVLDFTRRVEAEKCGVHNSRRIHKARTYILAHIGEPVTTGALAKELGLNRTYLCKMFAEETGETPGKYVTRVKMEEAMRLMDITAKSISEIAEYLGYSSQSHFQRVFRKFTGMTPGQYKSRGMSK